MSVSDARAGFFYLLLGAMHEAPSRLGWKTKVAELAVSVASQEILAQKRANEGYMSGVGGVRDGGPPRGLCVVGTPQAGAPEQSLTFTVVLSREQGEAGRPTQAQKRSRKSPERKEKRARQRERPVTPTQAPRPAPGISRRTLPTNGDKEG